MEINDKDKTLSRQSVDLDISGVGGYHPVGRLRDLGRCVRSFRSQSPLGTDTLLLGIAPYPPCLGIVDREPTRTFCGLVGGRRIIPCHQRSLDERAVGLPFGHPGHMSLVLRGAASVFNREIEGIGIVAEPHPESGIIPLLVRTGEANLSAAIHPVAGRLVRHPGFVTRIPEIPEQQMPEVASEKYGCGPDFQVV